MFKKYHKLENHYNVNPINLDMSVLVSVSEKIDGSNFSVSALDGDWRFASRNLLVSEDWNQLGELVPEHIPTRLAQLSSKMGEQINLYGEVFSSKILRRVPYGETRVRFFAAAIGGNYLSREEFNTFTTNLMCSDYVVPSLQMTLKDALDIDVEILKSQYAEDSIAEGIVIEPYYTNEFNYRTAVIKKKSSKFLEKSKVGKKLRGSSKEQIAFQEYINENRVLSYISKVGRMESNKQMGRYILAIIDDAWCEYYDTLTPDEQMEVNRKETVRPSGKMVAQLLIKLQGET